MKIIFIGSEYMGLYSEIMNEFQKQGHSVTYIQDDINLFDPGVDKNRFRRLLKFPLWHITLAIQWFVKLARNKSLREPYDKLFVLSGVSINSFIINYFRHRSPRIKCILYTWDNCTSYPFERLLPLFDNAFSFDIEDCNRNAKWKLLPIFYCEQTIVKNEHVKYDLFSVGSNRPGRYSFTKKILPQLKDSNSYYIRILSKELVQSKRRRLFNILFGQSKTTNDEDERVKFSLGQEHKELLIRKPLNLKEYNTICSQSRCVLDDQRDGQSGLTARFIWALANKQKIITTNKWALSYSFVNPSQVLIVDRDNPIVDLDFLRYEPQKTEHYNYEFLRIDNWVKTILS